MAPPEKEDSNSNRPVKRYSCDVRVGNWVDTLAFDEDKTKTFLKKRDRRELLIQNSRHLFNNMLKEVKLAVADEFVRFGTVVQLVAPDMPNARQPAAGSLGLALSGVVGEKDVDYIQHFVDGCVMSCSPTLIPCVRNSFFVVSPNDCPGPDAPLKYGECFNLCPVETKTNTPLYIRSETPMIDSVVGNSNHALVTLSSRRDTYARWRVLYWDPAYRLETHGAPVAPHARVVINHAPTNQNLSVEHQCWFDTFFGQECQASVHTYRDVHRRETAENMWQIVTAKPIDNNDMVAKCM